MIRLLSALVPNNVLALILSEAALIYACYLLAAYGTLDFSADLFLWEDRGLWRIAIVCLLIILGLHFRDLYDSHQVRSRIALLQQFCIVVGLAFLFQALLSYGRWDVILPKWLMVYGSALVLIVVPAWRLFFSSTVSKALGSERILFLGSSDAVQEIVAEIHRRPELGLVALGYLDDGETPRQLSGITRLGAVENLSAVLESTPPDRLVVGTSKGRGALPIERLLALRYAGLKIEEANTTFETIFHRISSRDLRPSQLIISPDIEPRESTLAIQAVYSWLIGIIGLVVVSPILLVVGILVKISSPGPVFFRRTCAGFNGKQFTLYKFRSMRNHAETRTAEARAGKEWTTKDGPRVTPLGRWLRKLRLDEWPQLLNVVRGDMSIVGPRPERPEFVDALQQMIPYYRKRLCVKPGITGWAQINHRRGDTSEDAIIKLEYELYYIKNLSMALDLFVMFHTLSIVLTGRANR